MCSSFWPRVGPQMLAATSQCELHLITTELRWQWAPCWLWDHLMDTGTALVSTTCHHTEVTLVQRFLTHIDADHYTVCLGMAMFFSQVVGGSTSLVRTEKCQYLPWNSVQICLIPEQLILTSVILWLFLCRHLEWGWYLQFGERDVLALCWIAMNSHLPL